MACLGKCSGFTHKYIKQLKFSDIRFVTHVISQLYGKSVSLSVVLNQPIIDVVAMLPEK
jgi:predicted amidophosphoribosyltransferase